MFFNLHNLGDFSFEVVQNTDIEIATYTDNVKKRAAADLDNLLHIPSRKKNRELQLLMKLF